MDDLTHHHLTLYAGDWERLQEIYTNPRLTPTKVVRELVRGHLRRVANNLTDRSFTENAMKPPLSGGKHGRSDT
jgi:hypothetical protein